MAFELKKWAPWNWFKDEEREQGKSVAVQRVDQPLSVWGSHPLAQFQQEFDRLFENLWRNFGSLPDFNLIPQQTAGVLLKPSVDIAATGNSYTITVEVPGVDEKDITLELVGDSLIIEGEKTTEKEEKDKKFYRIERSYGNFRRVLSLPEDADRDHIDANFKNGVLTISLPRKALSRSEGRRIEIQKAA